MITISKKTAMAAIKSGQLPQDLIKKKITIVMQENDAKRWLAALRDGRQKQTTGALYDPQQKAFCCLGLEQSCNWGGKVQTGRRPNDAFLGLPTTDYLQLTGKAYFEQAGRISKDGSHSPALQRRNGTWTSASLMNDSGSTFAQIADLLEKHMAVYA